MIVLDGTGLDPRWRQIVTVFNATEHPTTQTVPALAGVHLTPHPDQSTSADPLLGTAHAAAGVLNVPARSVAVFVADL